MNNRMKNGFSITNRIKLMPVFYACVAFYALHFMLHGLIDSSFILEHYKTLRGLLGWKTANVWVMKNELLQYLPLLLASILLVLRVDVKLR